MRYLVLVIASAWLLLSNASAQDAVLAEMKKDAEIVAHVKVLDVEGGKVDEIGVEEWAALCEVIDPIKGPIKKGDKIRFRFNRFDFSDHAEPMLVEKGKQYVVFLKGEAGGIRFASDDKLHVAHTLLDRWVGVLPYRFHLVHRLTEYLKDE